MRRGYTLVEVIISLSLVGLIIVFLLGLLPSTALMSREAEQQVAATHYAEEIVAHLDTHGFDDLAAAAAAGTPLTPAAPGFLEGVLVDRQVAGRATLTPTVTLSVMAPNDHLLQASVVIRWSSKRRNKSFTLKKRISSILR
jgi:prepilin-type N-terminal cleavage/methylation domain-containing protein